MQSRIGQLLTCAETGQQFVGEVHGGYWYGRGNPGLLITMHPYKAKPVLAASSRPTTALEALQRLNELHGPRGGPTCGPGTVQLVSLPGYYMEGEMEFEIHHFDAKPDRRRASRRGNTVFAFGHQMTMHRPPDKEFARWN